MVPDYHATSFVWPWASTVSALLDLGARRPRPSTATRESCGRGLRLPTRHRSRRPHCGHSGGRTAAPDCRDGSCHRDRGPRLFDRPRPAGRSNSMKSGRCHSNPETASTQQGAHPRGALAPGPGVAPGPWPQGFAASRRTRDATFPHQPPSRRRANCSCASRFDHSLP